MKITIAGVGAMGGRYALMLSRAGNDVDGIDGWADNVNAVNEHDLQANFDGEQVVAKIKAYEQTKIDPSAVADLVILFPKSMQLDGMMQSLKPVITDHTKILCLMNGIGHEEIIEKYVTRDNIFIGNTMWTRRNGRTRQIKAIRQRFSRLAQRRRRRSSNRGCKKDREIVIRRWTKC